MKLGFSLSDINAPLFVGLSSALNYGNLSLFEIIALLYVLYCFVFDKLKGVYIDIFVKYKLFIFYVVGSTMLFSSLINSTDIASLLKGSFAIYLIPTTILFAAKCLKNKSQVMGALIVYSSVLIISRNPEVVDFQNSFKFVFSKIIVYGTLLASIYAERNHSLKIRNIFAFIITILFVFLGFWGNLRLLGLVAALSLALLFTQYFKLFKLFTKTVLNNKFVLVISLPLFLLILSLSMSSITDLILNIIVFNEDALAKTTSQISGDFGLLFGGRSEIFSAIPAWLDKPIFGWGAWAKDPDSYYRILRIELLNEFGYYIDYLKIFNNIFTKSDLIPTHSLILNILVWGGLISFLPFYYWILNLVSLIIKRIGVKYFSYCDIFIFIFMFWNICFSPFGFNHRISLSLFLTFIYYAFVSCSNTEDLKSTLNV